FKSRKRAFQVFKQAVIFLLERRYLGSEIKAVEVENFLHHLGAIFSAKFQKFLKLPLRNNDSPSEVGIAEIRHQACVGRLHGHPAVSLPFVCNTFQSGGVFKPLTAFPPCNKAELPVLVIEKIEYNMGPLRLQVEHIVCSFLLFV